MAKEHTGSPKYHQLEARKNHVTWILAAWQSSIAPTTHTEITNKVGCDNTSNEAANSLSSSPPSSSVTLDFESHHQLVVKDSQEIPDFSPCNLSFSEYTPCQEVERANKFDREMLKYRERHCPIKEELLRCLIPAPPKYKLPFKWPQSRDYAWFNNIPHRELSIEKDRQNWIKVEGDRFRFPGGGTMFRHGADSYIDDINELIPLSNGSIRTA